MIMLFPMLFPRTSSFTSTTPALIMFNLRAAASERSTMRPLWQPQQSLTFTTTASPFVRVTRMRVPSGSVLWAAVIMLGS